MYLNWRTRPTIHHDISPFCCVAVRHTRVGRKSSGLNDAELPHLEGSVTLDRHIGHTLRGRRTTIRCASITNLLFCRPPPDTCALLQLIPLLFSAVSDYLCPNTEGWTLEMRDVHRHARSRKSLAQSRSGDGFSCRAARTNSYGSIFFSDAVAGGWDMPQRYLAGQ